MFIKCQGTQMAVLKRENNKLFALTFPEQLERRISIEY